MPQPLRARIAAFDPRDFTVADDGREFVFTLALPGVEDTVLRWAVTEAELARLNEALTDAAREAWGRNSGADGLFLVLNQIEEAVRTWPGGEGRIDVAGAELMVRPPW